MKVSIRALRVNRRLSQKTAAKELGITQRTLQNWENDATFPTGPQLMRICAVYGCELDDIFLPDTLAKSENK